MRKSRLKLVGSGGAGSGDKTSSGEADCPQSGQPEPASEHILNSNPLEVQALSVPSFVTPIVHEAPPVHEASGSLGDRIRLLQQEARALALQQVTDLERAMLALSLQSKDIAEGGDAYPVGARELARKLAADLPAVIQSLQVILRRQTGPGHLGKPV